MCSLTTPVLRYSEEPDRLSKNPALRSTSEPASLVNTRVMQMPLDVKTEEGGNYDPYRPGAPLAIFATGIRNSFDLVWHSNGHLYAGVNGSAAGGNAPA